MKFFRDPTIRHHRPFTNQTCHSNFLRLSFRHCFQISFPKPPHSKPELDYAFSLSLIMQSRNFPPFTIRFFDPIQKLVTKLVRSKKPSTSQSLGQGAVRAFDHLCFERPSFPRFGASKFGQRLVLIKRSDRLLCDSDVGAFSAYPIRYKYPLTYQMPPCTIGQHFHQPDEIIDYIVRRQTAVNKQELFDRGIRQTRRWLVTETPRQRPR
jgi:hypothetical protein